MSLEATESISVGSVIMGLVATNIVALISGYVSLKVGVARLEVKVDKLESDTNNLGQIMREVRNQKQGEGKC